MQKKAIVLVFVSRKVVLVDKNMILSFEIGNFRSIREKVSLGMEKSALKDSEANIFAAQPGLHLLKSAVIFGPNASGKSNLLLALKALEYLVLQSSQFKPDDTIAPYEPHKLEKTYRQAPVDLSVAFLAEGVRYDFHLAFSKDAIEKEELYFYPNGVRTHLYTRERDKQIRFGESYRGGKKTIEKLLLKNQLFLSKAAENNVVSLLPVYRFFNQGMMVFPFIEEYRESNLSRLYARRLAEDGDSSFARRFNSLICALDTGISHVSAEEVNWEEYKFPGNMPEEVKSAVQENYKYDIKTQHPLFEGESAIGYETFEIDEESKGTRSLFVIGGIILDALETGRVLVVDEFEKNLHPDITKFLISLFHNPLTNPRNAQLLFATHDITQLSDDHFRRDQVWFTEKDAFGVTSLFRCSDIKGVRMGTPLDKWYATGRFGATPIINDVDFLIEMQEDEKETV